MLLMPPPPLAPAAADAIYAATIISMPSPRFFAVFSCRFDAAVFSFTLIFRLRRFSPMPPRRFSPPLPCYGLSPAV